MNEPAAVQIIKMVSYSKSASLINLQITGVLADALRHPATNACRAVVNDGIARHIVTLEMWLVIPPLAINGQATHNRTGSPKANIIKIKPEIVMSPDIVLPTTSLNQG